MSTILHRPWRSMLSVLCVIFLCSCFPQRSTSTPPGTSVTAFSLSTTTTLTTPSLLVSTPELFKTPLSIATQFCMGSAASWSCTCGELSIQYIQIKNAEQVGVCEISLPHAYRIRLPNDWYCNIAGAAAINLACVTAYGQRIFVQAVSSELDVDDADKAINRFCEGEGCVSDPVIAPGENILEKESITIGDKPVLRVLSQQEDTFLLRYFIKDRDHLYVFRVEAKDLTETKASSSLLEKAIESMEFIP